MKNKIQLFESQQVRTAWDEENENGWDNYPGGASQ